jgi:hypothetical protein
MELYGSLLNISGSVTASSFTGSFIGDGSGLTGIQAAGVVGLNLSQIATGSFTASLSPNGFNVNTNTSITGAVNITGSISLNGEPIGTGKLNETTFQAYTSSNDGRVVALEISSGSLNSFTSSINTTIKSKLDSDGVISGSAQVNITGTTGYSTFSSSISSSIGDISSSFATTTNNLSTSIATTDLNQTNRLISIETKTGSYATTGSNLFIGTQTLSGSIIPAIDNAYDLGSPTYQWRDVYISSGSLYIDGTKVLSSTAQELTITTDNGQSIKILEGTTDSIILQTADGDIELKSSADGDILLDPTYGKIMLKGPVEILTGQKIQSSVGGTPVVFANDIVVSGSIDLTGTIDGIDLTAFSSSVSTRIGNLETSTGSLNEFTSSTNSRLTSIETSTGSLNTYTGSNNTIIGTLQTATSSLNTYTSSNTTNINAIHTATSSLNTFTSSINTTIKSKLDSDGVISGSSQVILTGTTGYSTFSSSVATSVNDLSSSINSLNSTDTSHNNRLDTIEGRYATTGSNVFIGDQTITGSLYISQNLIVQGSSSLENITASAVSIGTNTIILNSDSPAIRYAGISVFDSGSTNVTASLFYDSLTNNWKFKHSDVGTDDASILLFGPLGTGIDNAPTLVGNFLTKVEDDGHGHHLTTSSVFDNGSKISLKNNTEITGSLIVTSTIISQGTTLVSGSGQISYAGITNVPNGIVSGSGQVSFTGITDKPALVSGSSQVSFNGIADKPALVSGSSQISFNGITDKPTLVSGSSQILAGTTIHSGSFFNGITVVSGSGQISFNGITDKPTLVSGSSQITFGSISSIPGGIVSGSVQVDLTATTNYSSGIKTRLNAEGVLSGSAQVVASLPNGTVSGSAQITLSNTTGYGSVLNQAVLTTSSPTFSSVSATTFTGALSGNASTASTVSLSSGTAVNHTGSGEIYLAKWIGSSSPVPFIISASGSTVSNDATYGTLKIDRSNINANGAGSNFHFTILGTEYGGMGVTAETGVSSGSAVGKMRWYLTAAGTSRQERMTLDTSANLILYPGSTTGLFGLGDTGAGIYRDNTHDVVVHQSNSSGAPLYLSGAGNVVVSLDNNNNETDRKFIVGSNAVKASNELFSVNESGVAYASGGFQSPGSTLNLLGGQIYVSPTNNNTLNSGYNSTSDATDIWINYRGHNDGFSYYRNFNIGDGKGNNILWAQGTTGKVVINNGQSAPSDAKLQVNGNIDILDVTNGVFRIYNNTTFRGGLGTDAWAHAGSAANMTLFATGVLHFTSGGTKRAYFDTSGHLLPQVNNTYNLGSASLGWANVYTNDLHLSNMNKPEGNDIDGTSGNWTIQEGAENLYIINNNNGKKFKISLEEII